MSPLSLGAYEETGRSWTVWLDRERLICQHGLPWRSVGKFLRIAGVLVPLLLMVGCGLRRADPVEVIDPVQDQRIQEEVEARLAAEPSIAAGEVRVEVEGSRVRLHGSVHGIGAWYCALRTASLVEGVEAVTDFLVIERGPRDVTCLASRDSTAALVRRSPG